MRNPGETHSMAKPLFLLCLLACAGAAAAAQQAPALSLEQVVSRVQHDTGGTILAADLQHRGKRVEYRIKVLTPDGHVRVLAVPADAAPAAADSTKTPPGNGAGNKEKH